MPAAGGRHDWVLAVPALAGLVACRGAGVPGRGGPGPALVASLWSSWAWPRPSGAGPGCGGWSPPWAAAAAGLPLVALLCLRCALLSVGGAAAAAGVGAGPLPAQTVGRSVALRGAPGRPKLAGCRSVSHAPPARVVPARGVAAGAGKRRSPPASAGGDRFLHAHALGHVLGGVLHGPHGLFGRGLQPHAAWPTSGQGRLEPLSAAALYGEVAAG